ncbi:AbrB/MazE/SpoVT family DNA-binding domain-containing protein [Marinibactrum halimedae]|uniref:SpoVT-AbrB domain-containing protein n=1 Tax=Marinibactrum halimedae TaxID=1444977 RepID=A0AA37WND8_9GAMM|nr:hypothetical protein [Marinibactrum halimedae]MCD9459233.1 hypothetical protein [Marinibactrum halimedae]GLS27305.1 hypothetical protein GCM10007877_30240 [Marinibactrum halimedae]
MKLKVTEWGNSHGVRITAAMMKHLNVKAGDEVEVNITENGVEITKNNQSIDYLDTVKNALLDSIHKQSEPVAQVEDPYAEADVAYIVIAINPCSPEIRQVPKDTENAFATLADAKEAARQHIQSSIAEAQKSLSSLRQVGIGNISYIAL